MLSREKKRTVAFLVIASFLVATPLFIIQKKLKSTYNSLASQVVYDRNNVPISYTLNPKGYRAEYIDSVPKDIRKLLLKKEDRWFWVHPGFNPISTARAVWKKITTGRAGASSTLTQQLVKNLLGNESDRTIGNKLHELVASVALEFFTFKKQILVMYANTVYLGNGNQGMERASQSYFGKTLADLEEPEILSLLATLSSPHTQNPRTEKNAGESEKLADRLGVLDSLYGYADVDEGVNFATAFELQDLDFNCKTTCHVSIDAQMTSDIREMLGRHIERLEERGVETGAVVVISTINNEILALVGSPDPFSSEKGHSINMTVQPRPIGSTSKPFIYAKGFEAGLRPYTLVNDREYKYPVASGFSIYPKNFDGNYRGVVTLHEALTNSLNVPSVKTLEFVGTENFYDFLENDLELELLQTAYDYQYGAALGTLELDPLTLAHILTIFPHEGVLQPLSLGEKTLVSPMERATKESRVLQRGHTQLVTKLLSDRTTGAEQFGIKNNLSLPYHHYAVKTGTSRDFHDSWTVGYTPDYVVVAWLGNAQNHALNSVTGHSGAGELWHDVMQYLLNSSYTTGEPFSFDEIVSVQTLDGFSYGFLGEDIENHRNLLDDTDIITTPHNEDRILFDENAVIPLVAQEYVTWRVNDAVIGSGQHLSYHPTQPGILTIEATTNDGRVGQVAIELVSGN